MRSSNLFRPSRYLGRGADLASLNIILQEDCEWVQNRFLQLYEGSDAPEQVCALAAPWHAGVPKMSAALIQTIQKLTEADVHAPRLNDCDLPIVQFTAKTTQSHTGDGHSLTACLTLFKRLSKAYIDLALLKLGNALDRTFAIEFLNACFDSCEIAVCSQWENRKTLPGHVSAVHGHAGRIFAAIYDNASVAITIVAPDGTIALANAKCEELCGYSPEDIAGCDLEKFIHPEELDDVKNNVSKLLSGEIKSYRTERRIIKKGNTCMHVDMSTAGIPDENGNVTSLIVVMVDITKRKLAQENLISNERELRRYKELMKVIMDGMPAIMGYVDTDLRYKFVNNYYETLYGMTPKDVIGKQVVDLIGLDLFDKVKHYYSKALQGETVSFDLVFDSPVLGQRHLEANYLPHIFEGSIEGIIILILDVTDRKLIEQERDRFFDVSLDMFYVAGFDGYFRQTNPACTKILGWSAEELKKQKIIKFAHPDDRHATLEQFVEIGKGKSVVSFENRSRCKDGSYRYITWNSLGLLDKQLVYAIGHDTTHRHEMEEQLRTMATIDPLTRVMNRRHFFDLGEKEFHKGMRYDHTMSVFMLDLDYFKAVNDTHGHLAGDQVLRDIAAICTDILRDSDLFCRYGGEEFCGIIMEADAENAQATARRLLDGIAAHKYMDNITITASIGTATLNSADQSLEELLNRADTALYAAKRKGRNCMVHL